MNVFSVNFDEKCQVVEYKGTFFSRLSNVHGVNDVKQTEIHTAEQSN
jgi:hypothetical protein